MRRLLGAGILLVLVLPTFAFATTVYVKAGRLIDVVAGRSLDDQVIVLRGDRIMAVTAAADTPVPAGARFIDLSDKTVLPGLIDMHDHLTGDHRFHGYQSLGISLPRETLYGVLNARITLQAGFTTVRNVGASGYSDVALRDAINAGEIEGPRLRVSGPSLGITGGHCDNNLLPAEYADAQRRRGRRPVGGARQGPRNHQVRRRPDQVLRDRRRAVEGRQRRRAAVHARGNARAGRRGTPARTQGSRACARCRGHQGRDHGRRGLHRAREPDR